MEIIFLRIGIFNISYSTIYKDRKDSTNLIEQSLSLTCRSTIYHIIIDIFVLCLFCCSMDWDVVGVSLSSSSIQYSLLVSQIFHEYSQNDSRFNCVYYMTKYMLLSHQMYRDSDLDFKVP